MSREDEIRQGLREPSGVLIGGLHVLDYVQGVTDFEQGNPPPKLSSTSYDLGRSRAREKVEQESEVRDWIAREDARRDKAFREVLKDRPDLIAEYDAKMAAIKAA